MPVCTQVVQERCASLLKSTATAARTESSSSSAGSVDAPQLLAQQQQLVQALAAAQTLLKDLDKVGFHLCVEEPRSVRSGRRTGLQQQEPFKALHVHTSGKGCVRMRSLVLICQTRPHYMASCRPWQLHWWPHGVRRRSGRRPRSVPTQLPSAAPCLRSA